MLRVLMAMTSSAGAGQRVYSLVFILRWASYVEGVEASGPNLVLQLFGYLPIHCQLWMKLDSLGLRRIVKHVPIHLLHFTLEIFTLC